MILIKNNIKKVKINTNQIKKDVTKMLRLINYQDFDIGIWFTTNKTIQAYNKKYRKKDKATDILSFPYHTNLKPGQKIKIASDDDKNLGDIIISLEYCKQVANEMHISLQKHLKTLLAHGITHLLGYTHKTDTEHAVMQRIENKLLS